MANDDRPEKARQLSEEMRQAFEQVIQMLDSADAWTDFQSTFDKIHSLLIEMDADAQRYSIEMLTCYIELSLLQKGFRHDEVSWIKNSVICNWQKACESKVKIEARAIYNRINVQWRNINHEYQDNSTPDAPLLPNLLVPLGRLFTGAAALVFDALKILTIIPVPNFVAITIMGGAALFYNGVDGILKDARGGPPD